MIILNHNSAKTITQAELKNRVHYCQETGIFTWVNCNKYHSEKNNSKAGCVNNNYIKIKIDGKCYAAHKLAWLYMFGYIPKFVDHINGRGIDNRISNLRECDHQQNTMNHGRKTNRSGLPCGVREIGKGFQARITFMNKQHNLGVFQNASDAERAYIDKRNALFGEFSRDNY